MRTVAVFKRIIARVKTKFLPKTNKSETYYKTSY
jgi:hypothetical protein